MTGADTAVVVIGAGPTGVTAASLLAAYGVDCLVLDRWADVYPQPRAVHLDDEVYRVLGRLGLAGEFAAISRPATGLRLLDHEHRVLAEFCRDQLVGVHGYPQANMFEQPELEALLRRHMATLPTVAFRGGVKVTAVDHVTDDRVRVVYNDRDSGAEEIVTAKFVLGCDGANSLVRSSIGATMEQLGFEQRWLVIDVQTDCNLAAWDGVHQVCDTERAATYMRIGPRRYRWEFRLQRDEAASDFSSIAAIAPLLRPWTGSMDTAELHLVRTAEYTFRAQIANRWRDRRIFILGDAAHLTPPFIGQGMGAGLRDALNLSWKVAGVLAGDLDNTWLDTYQSERAPHARALIRLAMLMGQAMTGGGKVGDLARGLLAPRLRLVPGLRSKVVDSATPPLRARSVALDSRPWRRLAGSLCPNASMGSGRLDDEHDGGFLVVTTTPPTPSQRTLFAHRGVTVIEAQPGTELHDWLVAHGAAAVVRPDGAVLSVGRSLNAVARRVPRFTAHMNAALWTDRRGHGCRTARTAPAVV